MKKLLTTSALAGSALILGSAAANAQTTVSGNLNLSYKALSNKSAGIGSLSGFGKETQINLANKGKLNIAGWEYAAGFSIEHDGTNVDIQNATLSSTSTSTTTIAGHLSNVSGMSSAASLATTALTLDASTSAITLSLAATTTTTTTSAFTEAIGDSQRGIFSENVYIDFINGNTTISIGADHFDNPNFTITSLVSHNDPDDLMAGTTSSSGGTVKPLFVTDANSPTEAFGVGIKHKFPIGTLSYYFAPNDTNAHANDDLTSGTTRSLVEGSANSAQQVMFRGDVGVKGLDIFYAQTKRDKDTSTNFDVKGVKFGAKYNFGQFTIAADRGKNEGTDGGGANVTTNKNVKSTSYGAAFAINKDLSIGLQMAKTKDSTLTSEEKFKSANIGYSLGPVSVNLTYAKADDVGGVAGQDSNIGYVQVGTRF